jgi:hypothetical protein
MWCAATGDPYPMEKNPDEIPMFAQFVERRLALPASDFFKGLLDYYGIEYLNLNPNGIFHVSVHALPGPRVLHISSAKRGQQSHSTSEY